jgi:glycerol uptake facilitator-like aquaporin
MLFVLVSVFGPISGAHFNPAVTLVFAFRGEISWLDAGLYILIQLVAAIAGVLLAHAMFDLELLQNSVKSRSGPGMRISETVATFGLLMTILGTLKSKPVAVPAAVGLYVSAGYWFTASTCFANPAVTIARSFTNTFSGIASQDVLPFILFQLAGAILAYIVSGWLFPKQGPGLLES